MEKYTQHTLSYTVRGKLQATHRELHSERKITRKTQKATQATHAPSHIPYVLDPLFLMLPALQRCWKRPYFLSYVTNLANGKQLTFLYVQLSDLFVA